MLTKNLRPCPICGQSFSHFALTKHVNSCLDKQEYDPDFAEQCRPPAMSDKSKGPPTKRAKIGGDKSHEFEGTLIEKSSHLSDLVNNETNECVTKVLNKNIFLSPTPNIQSRSQQNAFSPTSTAGSRKFVWPRKTMSTEKCTESPPKGTYTNPKESNATKSLFKEDHKSSVLKFQTDSNFPVIVKDRDNDIIDNQEGTTAPILDLKTPLADQMRPTDIKDYVGQDKTVGRSKLLRELLESHQIPSMIFWGPPGCGKTTLAKIVAKKTKESHDTRFVQISATTSGVADVKEVIKVAKNDFKMWKRRTILFVDEIHRFNKLQQDTFLPHVEDGTITLLGATTENPSFQVNNALLSRCRVIVLEKLSIEDLMTILNRALLRLRVTVVDDSSDSAGGLRIHEDAVSCLANFCDGDARGALNALETVVRSKKAQVSNDRNVETRDDVISVENVKEVLQRSHIQYDRAGDEHYHCASALQKSVRGSNDNAALYWMTRMFEGGEDPLFIARRLLVCASEDIGMADPQALPIAMATFHACQVLGRPECAINLAHCTTYLARAPKSNAIISALHAAQKCIRDHEGALPGVPLHLRNASSQLARKLGYGKGYKYYDAAGTQEYLPKELSQIDFYSQKGEPP